MAIKITFDTAKQPEKPLLILTKRNCDKIDVINNVTDIPQILYMSIRKIRPYQYGTTN